MAATIILAEYTETKQEPRTCFFWRWTIIAVEGSVSCGQRLKRRKVIEDLKSEEGSACVCLLHVCGGYHETAPAAGHFIRCSCEAITTGDDRIFLAHTESLLAEHLSEKHRLCYYELHKLKHWLCPPLCASINPVKSPGESQSCGSKKQLPSLCHSVFVSSIHPLIHPSALRSSAFWTNRGVQYWPYLSRPWAKIILCLNIAHSTLSYCSIARFPSVAVASVAYVAANFNQILRKTAEGTGN